MAKCGFCKNEITKEDIKEMKRRGGLKITMKIYLLSCPHCDSVLGVYDY